jgi:glycosyltransferase involved in cell wall biosynthesis
MTELQRLTICVVIAARNEKPCLQFILPLLAEQSIHVAIIDHESTDGSHDLCKQLRYNPVVAVDHLPYTGEFSLSDQLLAKQQLAEGLPHTWLVHHDADELMHHCNGIANLRQCIEEAEAEGANAVNFEEFVFLPDPGSQSTHVNYLDNHKHYYYFVPAENRLNRAFRRELIGSNLIGAGHVLQCDDLKLSATTHVLRHYIALSEAHIKQKYASRKFSASELARGWHSDRVAIPPDSLSIPRFSPYLCTLSPAHPGLLERSRPASKHYWQWNSEERME